MAATPVAAAPTLKVDIAYAGFWRRAAAYLIDGVILGTAEFALAAAASLVAPGDWRAAANVAPVSAAIAWAYFALFESSPARGTIGKLAFGLYVGDLSGDPITFWRASLRYWMKIFSTLIFGVGWLMAAFTPRKQALHDLLAGTVVLRRVHLIVFGTEPPIEPGEYWDGTRWSANVVPPLENT